jgi:hypothetical protein
MTEAARKLPGWVWSAMWYVISLVFAAGIAYETFAPKPWVEAKIKEHEVRTEEARKEDMRDIKESLKRIEERQYQAAQNKR